MWNRHGIRVHLCHRNYNTMSMIKKSGSLSIRRNTHMRSLWIEYPRLDTHNRVLADLLNLHSVDMNIDLPVITADTSGITLMLPDFLSGMFYLKIQDGEKSFLERIAIQ